MAHVPGTVFNYNSGDWHLVSAILAKKTGLDTLEYARRTLFAPLGIADATWRADPQGVRSGGFGLSLQPRDMAKIGYLYLQRGRWAGQRIVSEAWVDRVFHATRRHEPRHHAALSLRRRLVDDPREARLPRGRLPAPDDHRAARRRPRRRRHGQEQLSVPAARSIGSPRWRPRRLRCRPTPPATRASPSGSPRRPSRRRRRSGPPPRWPPPSQAAPGASIATRSACARSAST